ncbi:hypothetical protein PAXRUDRAFT_166327 [Paxillus rubicundulus Ve08.2h10]|uniref:F-box domain-containing protein n=1 Tax=Paxillus rubicundulus Ve08.2h10 TaxID=930991 RepID=A0A0D0C371_9AGAM|nr:hypothetical protein PAXRUDRAFT_166327 [Paxillus rubicundulus Ve08.2h10]
MHPCLNIAEIQEIIFAHVRGPVLYEGKLDYRQRRFIAMARGTLAALARTCSSFTEPALDVLWYDLDTFEPLLRSLPLDIWSRGGYSLREARLSRDLQLSDWDYLQKHCSRVRILGRLVDNIFDSDHPYVSGSVPVELLENLFGDSRAPTCVFPKLEKLFWNNGKEAVFRYFTKFFAPTLTCIRVATEDWTTVRSSTLHSLQRRCPQVNDFGFFFPGHGYFFVGNQVGQFSDTIRTLFPVERLAVCAIDYHAFRHLSTLTTLKSLFVQLPCAMDYYCPVEISFPETLGTLDVLTYHLKFVLKLLANKRFASRHLNIRSRYHYPAKSLTHFFEQLRDHFSSDHLTHLSLDITEPSVFSSTVVDIQSQNTFDVQCLPVLFEFQSLSELKLASYWTLDLDDGWMSSIASSLPNLQVLDLGTESGCDLSHTVLKVTMRGVVSLIDGLPRLRALGLVFDATLEALPAAHDYWGVWNSNITILRVGTSPINAPTEVASRLLSLFPSLKQVEMSGLDDVRYKWERVSELLQTYSRVKEGGLHAATSGEDGASYTGDCSDSVGISWSAL